MGGITTLASIRVGCRGTLGVGLVRRAEEGLDGGIGGGVDTVRKQRARRKIKCGNLGDGLGGSVYVVGEVLRMSERYRGIYTRVWTRRGLPWG